MKRAGYVLSPTGTPMSLQPVSVKNVATDVVVATSATNSAGRWDADLVDETAAYKVEIGGAGGATQRVVQAPASIELEWLFVRYGMKVVGGPVTLPAITTGAITTTGGGTITATDAPLVCRSTSNARVMLIDTNAPTNEKAWGVNNNDGDFGIQPWVDAENSASGDGLFLIRGTGIAIANAGLTIGGVQRVFANTNGVVLTGANTNTGTLTVTGQVLAGVGTAGTPGYAFAGDENTGVFRNNEGQISMVSNGSIRLSSTLTGADVQGGLGISGDLVVSGVTTVAQTTVGGGLTVNGGLNVMSGSLHIENAFGNTLDVDVNATIDGTLVVAGLTTTAALDVGGTLTHKGGGLGFYNSGSIPRPTVTGAKAGNAALTSLLAALGNLGLIINSTT